MHIKIIAVGVSLQLKEPRRAEAMTIDPSNAMNADSRDQILAQLCSEFLVDAQDRLEDIAHELKTSQTPDSDAEETLLAIRRQCHSLKGMGGAFGFPTITLIAHRLEDYLARAHVINPRIVRDINFYCQRLLHIISNGEDPGPDAAAEIIHALPTFSLFDVEDIVPLSTEILLVTPSKTIGVIVGRELAGCGYKVTRFSNAWEAMQFAASTRPDLVITAAIMDVIDGVNLLRALSAMAPTADIPVALLTSLDIANRELEGLPSGVAIIRHGENFSEDLAEMLADFESGDMTMAANA
jgi:CheY-like chemotaxis protein/HPt (histidine-containing phosphotransfer) domain-containing protein